MKRLNEYCSVDISKLLVEKFNYPKDKLHWIKFSTFNYQQLARLDEVQSWLREEHTYHILVRHPKGFHGDGMEFWKWTYEIIIKNSENNWEGIDISKIGIFDSYEEALKNAICDLITGNVNLDIKLKYENWRCRFYRYRYKWLS